MPTRSERGYWVRCPVKTTKRLCCITTPTSLRASLESRLRAASNQAARIVVLWKCLGHFLCERFVESFEDAILVHQFVRFAELAVREAQAVVSLRHCRAQGRGFLERVGGFFVAARAEAGDAETVLRLGLVGVEFD